MIQMISNTARLGIKKQPTKRLQKLKIALVLYHLPEFLSSNLI